MPPNGPSKDQPIKVGEGRHTFVQSPNNTTGLAEEIMQHNLPYNNQKKTMDLNTTHLSDFDGEEENQ